MSPAARRRVAGWAAAAVAAAGLAARAAAQDPVYAPCLAPQEDLAGYRAAFEAAGWTVPEGEARERALRGPSEHLLLAIHMPDPAQTLEELSAFQARAHEWGREEFAAALVVAKDDMGAAVDLLPVDEEVSRLRCILTAPKIGEVNRILGNAQPGDWTPFTIRVIFPTPLPGTSDLQIEATRAIRLVTPPEPLPGTDAIIVGLTLGSPVE